eukprot:scaffold13247_cov154-Skeletonema_menzelii.AAC.1
MRPDDASSTSYILIVLKHTTLVEAKLQPRMRPDESPFEMSLSFTSSVLNISTALVMALRSF